MRGYGHEKQWIESAFLPNFPCPDDASSKTPSRLPTVNVRTREAIHYPCSQFLNLCRSQSRRRDGWPAGTSGSQTVLSSQLTCMTAAGFPYGHLACAARARGVRLRGCIVRGAGCALCTAGSFRGHLACQCAARSAQVRRKCARTGRRRR